MSHMNGHNHRIVMHQGEEIEQRTFEDPAERNAKRHAALAYIESFVNDVDFAHDRYLEACRDAANVISGFLEDGDITASDCAEWFLRLNGVTTEDDPEIDDIW